MNSQVVMSAPNEYEIKYPAQMHKVSIDELISHINKFKVAYQNPKKITVEYVYSNKYDDDGYDQSYEIEVIKIIYLNTNVPQLVKTFCFSFISDSSAWLHEYQFLIDDETKRALFQGKFDNGRYVRVQEDEDSTLFVLIKRLFEQSGYTFVV